MPRVGRVTPSAKFFLYLAGTALLLLSLVYVGISVAKNWSTIEHARIRAPAWLLASIAVYAVSHLSTGLSWPLAVRQLGTAISIKDGLRIGLVSQIGKYLPGNIAHYGSRVALAADAGIPLKSSGISTAIELGSALIGMALVSTIGLLVDPRPLAFLPEIHSPAVILIAVGVFCLFGGMFWFARKGTHPALLAGPTICLAVSFVLSGVSFFALARALGIVDLPLAATIGAFALAWGIGFVVPGAPAGMGVREATLLALFGPMIGSGPAVVVTIFHRLVTAAVDVVAALIGYIWLTSGALPKK